MKKVIIALFAFCLCSIMSSFTKTTRCTMPSAEAEVMITESDASTYWYIKDDTFACTTESAFDEMIRACNRKDQSALERMAARGTLAILKKGTHIEMIKYGFAKCRIQALSGSYQDMYFYVVTESVGKR